MEVADPPAIAAVATDGFDAVFGEINGVIGEDAVKVEDDGVDGLGKFISDVHDRSFRLVSWMR